MLSQRANLPLFLSPPQLFLQPKLLFFNLSMYYFVFCWHSCGKHRLYKKSEPLMFPLRPWMWREPYKTPPYISICSTILFFQRPEFINFIKNQHFKMKSVWRWLPDAQRTFFLKPTCVMNAECWHIWLLISCIFWGKYNCRRRRKMLP